MVCRFDLDMGIGILLFFKFSSFKRRRGFCFTEKNRRRGVFSFQNVLHFRLKILSDLNPPSLKKGKEWFVVLIWIWV